MRVNPPWLFPMLSTAVLAGLGGFGVIYARPLWAQAPPASSASLHPVGSVKSIQGNTVTLATASGSEISVAIQASTQMFRALPGQKNLKEMTPIALADLQAGDRILVRGETSSDGKSMVASSVIVMKGADIAARRQQEREDWQRRGLGGLVSAVDAGSGTVTLSTAAGAKSVVIKVAKTTVIRRYAPDSIKFDDAQPGSLDEIKPGDQLCARGERSADAGELVAEEIVSGTFRNIAGTINSIDPTNASINVLDLATKKPVTVRITPDSQLKNLPPFVAQRIALRLKGGAPGAPSGGTAENGRSAGTRTGVAGPGGELRTERPGDSPDLQQILSRMPAVALENLQKGEAVIMVATVGSANSPPAAITLLTGVEAILTAAPGGSGAAELLSPWNLNTSMGESPNP